MSANTETELAPVKASVASVERLLVQRDKRISALERGSTFDAKIMQDLLVG